MNSTNKKIIRLALGAMVLMFFGSEMIIAFKSSEPYTTNQIRPWFALLIASLFYVFAKQISERSNK